MAEEGKQARREAAGKARQQKEKQQASVCQIVPAKVRIKDDDEDEDDDEETVAAESNSKRALSLSLSVRLMRVDSSAISLCVLHRCRFCTHFTLSLLAQSRKRRLRLHSYLL